MKCDALLKRALQYDKRKQTKEEKFCIKQARKHGVKGVVVHQKRWKCGKPLINDDAISVGEVWLKRNATDEEQVALLAYRLRGLVIYTESADATCAAVDLPEIKNK